MKFPTLLHMLFINPFSKKKLKFAATGLRKQEQQLRDLIKISDMLSTNKLKTVIDRTYSLDQIQEAHRYVDAGHKKGNVIIKLN